MVLIYFICLQQLMHSRESQQLNKKNLYDDKKTREKLLIADKSKISPRLSALYRNVWINHAYQELS